MKGRRIGRSCFKKTLKLEDLKDKKKTGYIKGDRLLF
jgi:hypothetical protein